MAPQPDAPAGAGEPETASAARFRAAIARFDAVNAEDPSFDSAGGSAWPGALLYGQRMSLRLNALVPQASEALRLAVRAQHLQRWAIPRASYPAGRKGYHRWRTALAGFHAERAGAILREVGYGEALVARVQSLLRKERLRLDPEAQLLEDAVCLVFLEHYLLDFGHKHEESKVVDILRKTWRKMSSCGQQAALQLSLPGKAGELVRRALAE
jgi:hypothetical protein